MKHLLAFAIYLALAVIVTWPMAIRMETAVTDEGDPLHLSWILDWNIHALTHKPLHIFDAPIFYPSKYPLAYSENLIGVALLALPFHFLGVGPIGIYNVALLLGLALSAWSGYLLGWTIARKYVPALVAGLLYGFVPYKFSHVQHLQLIWSPCVALMLAAILLYRAKPTAMRAALVAASLAANALMNLYYFLFGAVILALSLLLIAIAERRDARFWLRLAAALAVAGILLVPILRPYWIVSKEYGMERKVGEALSGSAKPYDWLIAGGRSRLYGTITDPGNRRGEELELFPGILLIALPLAALLMTPLSSSGQGAPGGLTPAILRALDVLILLLAIGTYFALINDRVHITWNGRSLLAYRGSTAVTLLLVIAIVIRLAIRFPRALGEGNLRSALARSRFPLELWIAALWVVVGFIGSLGMHTPFHTFLLEYVPSFRATRAPCRWAMVTYAGLAAWAAAGMTIVAATRWRAALFCALALLDVWPRIQWMHTVVEPSEVDRWIARERAGPIYELPFARWETIYLMVFRATVHHRPTFNGMSSFEPPLHVELARHSYDARTLDILERQGCRFVIFRPEWCSHEAVPILEWLRDGIARCRLAFVRRFDYNTGGDWVFAVTRNERDWQRQRAPNIPDGAGFTPDQALARLLAGQRNYNGNTFGRMSTPRPYAEIKGPLDITGLAMSPFGIRSVTARIDNGRLRIPVPLFERADYTQAYPWYPQTPRPGFSLRIPQRPKGVGKYTDVQIEIVDGRGGVTLLPGVPVTWN
jgi:hypothetical protein